MEAVLEREAWLEERKTGVGASEVAAVCGIARYSSPRKVWMVKKGLVVEEDRIAMRYGRFLEPFVAELFAETMAVDLHELEESGLVRHPLCPYKICTPDRLWNSPEGRAAVELKTVDSMAAGDFGPSWTDQVKVEYLLQVGWQMRVLGVDVGFLFVLIGNRETRVYKFTWTDLMVRIVDEAEARVDEFWQYMVDDEPPPIGGGDCDTEIAKMYAAEQRIPYSPESEWPLLPDDLDEEIPQWQADLAQFEKLKTAIAARENRLKEAIAGADGILATKGKATYRQDKNGKATLRYDWKKVTE